MQSVVSIKKLGKQKIIPLLENPRDPFQEKVHVSTWWITINSNKMAQGDSDRVCLETDLSQALIACFGDLEILCRFLNFNQKYFPGYTLTPDLLQDRTLFPDLPGKSGSALKLSYVTETGSERHRVHLHAEFRVIHYTNLTLSPGLLKREFERYLQDNIPGCRFSSVYVHVKWIKSQIPILNYMVKEGHIKRPVLVEAVNEKLDQEKLREYKSGNFNDSYEEAVMMLRALEV